MLGKRKIRNKILEIIFPADNSKTSYANEQFYTLFHILCRKLSFWQKVFKKKNAFSLELVSTKNEGVRYLLVADEKFIDNIKRSLLSYLPGIKVEEVDDYLKDLDVKEKIIELKLSNHFAYSLLGQDKLLENDPISYLTGNMTKLDEDDVIAVQFIISPVVISTHININMEIKRIKKLISEKQSLKKGLKRNIFQKILLLPCFGILFFPIYLLLRLIYFGLTFLLSMVVGFFDTSGKSVPWLQKNNNSVVEENNLYETEMRDLVKGKMSQPLFETSIRLLVTGKDKDSRLDGLLSALGQLNSPYQSLKRKNIRHLIDKYISRKLSLSSLLNPNPILSVSELASFYHFPNEITTKTEDLVKLYSKELPPSLSMKNSKDLEVVFGKNNYGGKETMIGLSGEERSRHLYILGQTGSGKTTVMFHMAKDDIVSGRGLAVLDPHGDLAKDLLNTVSKNRINDCIYFNPADLKHPIGLNLMEIPKDLTGEELEQEKELVCEGLISIFRRVFNKEENNDSHRIEYILRNTIYTAFNVPEATIFTVFDLLTNPKFRKRVILLLDDENLKNFWKNEFGKAGNYQVVKMASGVTAKIGRFLFSPTAKRILEQPKSTINFDEILDKGKILICNLAEGSLGEDTSQLLGTTIITKIQQAAVRRVRQNRESRIPFHLFIDEFQNFATSSFIKLLSGGRKFGLRLTVAEQSSCQQEDRNVVNVILANCGTVICFRTASPIDGDLMLSQFQPYVTLSDIVNLPRYHFLMKVSAVKPEEPMSGETIPIAYKKDDKKLEEIIESSRKNYAREYKPSIKTIFKSKKVKANTVDRTLTK